MCMGVGEGLRPVLIWSICLGPTRAREALLGAGSKVFPSVSASCTCRSQCTLAMEHHDLMCPALPGGIRSLTLEPFTPHSDVVGQ